MDGRVRRAGREDASRLAEILVFTKRVSYRNIFKDDFGSFHKLQTLPLALQFRDGENALKDIWVYDDGIVKGMIHWGEKEEGVVQLYELYVDSFFQGEHIGSILMEDCLVRSRECGARKMMLWVLEKNERARKFYEKFGFRFNGISEKEPGYEVLLLQYEKALLVN